MIGRKKRVKMESKQKERVTKRNGKLKKENDKDLKKQEGIKFLRDNQFFFFYQFYSNSLSE